MFRATYVVLRDADDAADAAQEAFIRAYRGLRGFKAGRQVRPWLVRIAMNQALNALKSKRRRAAVADRLTARPAAAVPDIDETVIGRERSRALWSALESLGERERTVLYLRYFVQMPEGELAEYLGCPVGTVKSRVHRALRKPREVVGRQYPELLSEVE